MPLVYKRNFRIDSIKIEIIEYMRNNNANKFYQQKNN